MRTAVVLFNLGGPDRQEAVEPFLFNLFNDPAIIGLPGLLRWPLARLLARRRAPLARAIYQRIGGGSPLLPNTEAQAAALTAALGPDTSCFIAMRYWHPRAAATVQAVAAWRPDRILLLPLYPQYSTTTTGSSVIEWRREAARVGLSVPTGLVCCWPDEPGFVASVAERVRAGLARLPAGGRPPRILFSAHGLPKRVVAAGDPYQWQVERSVAAVVEALGPEAPEHVICYQSRVGPLEWLGPATDAEIRRAGRDGVPLVVAPIAFVSEHSETLVELDLEYRHLAERSGVPAYVRVPTVDTLPAFIAGLAGVVRHALAGGRALSSGAGGRLCPAGCGRCPCTGTDER